MLRRTALKARSRYKPVELERYHEWGVDLYEAALALAETYKRK